MSIVKGRLVGFSADKMRKQLTNYLVGQQTARLISYARKTIEEIGNEIQSRGFDRTGNLLNSLCWGVSYNGKLVDYGFFTDGNTRGESYLHEWSFVEWKDRGAWSSQFPSWIKSDASEEVHGRELAENYIQKYGNDGSNGWKVFWAILAPYWGYWEKGFNLRHGFGAKRSSFRQFVVMANVRDKVKSDIKPARKIYFHVSVAKYTSKSLYSRAKKNFFGR